jgi:hypothetical protein
MDRRSGWAEKVAGRLESTAVLVRPVVNLVAASALIATITACNKSSPAGPSPTTPPANCAYSVGGHPEGPLPSTGAEFTLTVTATAGCSWSAISFSGFVTMVGSASGSGNGSVKFAVAANTGAQRVGTIELANQTISVHQNAVPVSVCDFTANPTDTTIGIPGGEVAVNVTVTGAQACTWTTTSLDPFVTIKSGATGTGNGTAVLTIAANAGAPRIGGATVAGKTVMVRQDGTVAPPPVPPGCVFSIDPTLVSVPATGFTQLVGLVVSQGTNCAWTAVSQSSFITFSGPTSGVGSANIFPVIAPNPGQARTGTVVIAGLTATFNQAANPNAGYAAVLSIQGDPCGMVGGQSKSYTLSGPEFTVSYDPSQSEFKFGIPPGNGDWWFLTMAAPAGQQLSAGFYDRAQRWTSQTPGQPGLEFFGNHSSCGDLTGRFLVDEATYGPNNTVRRFHARFEQHCGNSSPTLRCEIWIDAQGSTTVPSMPQMATPSTPTTFLAMQSDPGDPIGTGRTVSLAIATATFSPTSGPANVKLQLQSFAGEIWFLSFYAPSGTQLGPGTYNNAARSPSPPSTPGLSVFGNGVACATVTGKFVVVEAVYGSQGEVYRFHATFEQHCDGVTPALRGELRIVADPWR